MNFCTLKSSPRLQRRRLAGSFSIYFAVFNWSNLFLCMKPGISVCLCVVQCDSAGTLPPHPPPRLTPPPPPSARVVLWCQPSISDPFLRFTANFTPSSLRRLNPSIILAFILPQFEANSTLFTGKYRWSPGIPAICMLAFFFSLPPLAAQPQFTGFYLFT